MHASLRKNKCLIDAAFLLGLSFLFFACKGQKSTNEPKNIETLIPQSKREKASKSKNSDTVNVTNGNPFEEVFNHFAQGKAYTIFQHSFYIDRFGPKNSQKIIFTNDSTTATLSCWSFSDSLKTLNAFYNWLDCFGNKCRSIKIGDRIRITENSGEIWLKDTLLIYWKSENSEINSVQENAINGYIGDSILYQLKWKKNHYTQWIRQND
jgi:hypothetical protein